MLFVPTRNGCHDLRWLHGTPQPPENGGQKNLPTLQGFVGHISANAVM
ncbi:hypothetical protein MGMO_53c00290 [Methyloglobulus morosus KoM1]|uniref:Uncharacterized protein n=1 Tax=Methyloglobulus morosus KoM1 TaxID=1116472 RepID=V5BH02_9GAMM|nr:hypothetical protein [Methyloglobulus morosus]ESS72570.1 hypothetical protein MGMO_53c00290 [Methyloglobulus morosus KoM1]